MRKFIPFAACVVLALVAPRPACAHKLNVFATAEGKTISGQAYARGGEPVREATVSVFATDGKKLGETRIDQKGEFTFPAEYRCDHHLVVDGGGGHTAEYVLKAGELPQSLPVYGTATSATDKPAPVKPGIAIGSTAPRKPAPAPAATGAESHAAIEEQIQSLGQQIRQLRHDLAAYKEAVRFQDILGGIGYILGLMGLAYYFLGAKRKAL